MSKFTDLTVDDLRKLASQALLALDARKNNVFDSNIDVADYLMTNVPVFAAEGTTTVRTRVSELLRYRLVRTDANGRIFRDSFDYFIKNGANVHITVDNLKAKFRKVKKEA